MARAKDEIREQRISMLGALAGEWLSRSRNCDRCERSKRPQEAVGDWLYWVDRGYELSAPRFLAIQLLRLSLIQPLTPALRS